jgi:hypothetical protein
VPLALSPYTQVTNIPVILEQTCSKMRIDPSFGPQSAIYSIHPRSLHSYGPKTAVSSNIPHFHRRTHCPVLVMLRRHCGGTVRVKCSTTNVVPKTNMRHSFTQPQDPRAFTALKWPCSHDSRRVRLCQDGTVIRERSDSKHSKCPKTNVCRRMRHQVLSTDRQLPSWEVQRGTRITRMCVKLAYHTTHSFEVEVRGLTRDNAHVNMKYVTKVMCHATRIKHVCMFAMEFAGPDHLQGQVVHSQ